MKVSFKNIPKTTDLFLDYIYKNEKVQDFYARAPYNESGYKEHFKALQDRSYKREQIASVLKEQNRNYGNFDMTLASIERIKNVNTFVVFTGQQAGLFGGPLYTIYKAMTAINLARYLTMTTPYTFLPLFWIEGEDHDFEEIRRAYFIDRDNNLANVCYEPETPFIGQSVGSMVLDKTINIVIDRYAQSIHDSDFKEMILDFARKTYAPGKTIAEAFASWMTGLLGQYGLIMVDPSDYRLKEIAFPVYEASLEKHRSEINPALERVNERLRRSGYHRQVGHRLDTLDFFYHDPRRLPFIRENDTYYLKNTDLHFSFGKLKDFLRANIASFSPNVILRPQVQDFIFPTAAYVAGPSEIAYFAQYKDLYRIFGTPMPIIYPRKSLTILEGKIDKIMQKYGIEIEEIFQERHDLEKKVLKKQLPPGLQQALEKADGAIFGCLEEVEKQTASLDPNLKSAVSDLKVRVKKELHHLQAKITRSVEKKSNIIKDQIEKLFINLFPDNHLQERRLSILNFIYKYQYRLIYSLMELTCCRHESNHVIWKVEI